MFHSRCRRRRDSHGLLGRGLDVGAPPTRPCTARVLAEGPWLADERERRRKPREIKINRRSRISPRHHFPPRRLPLPVLLSRSYRQPQTSGKYDFEVQRRYSRVISRGNQVVRKQASRAPPLYLYVQHAHSTPLQLHKLQDKHSRHGDITGTNVSHHLLASDAKLVGISMLPGISLVPPCSAPLDIPREMECTMPRSEAGAQRGSISELFWCRVMPRGRRTTRFTRFWRYVFPCSSLSSVTLFAHFRLHTLPRTDSNICSHVFTPPIHWLQVAECAEDAENAFSSKYIQRAPLATGGTRPRRRHAARAHQTSDQYDMP